MEKFLNTKTQVILLAILVLLTITNSCNSCNQRKAMMDLKESQESIKLQVDSMATLKQIDKSLKIEGLKTSKRMLYDNNAIVRTAIRPDDRMNEYDSEIEKLEKQK
jgi:plasmid rolling circle replication initiator protein Rep